MPPPSRPLTRPAVPAAGRWPDVLDVHLTAQLLTVSADTVYDLLQRGDLPGRKVGRKWLTTKTAVLKWLEQSATPRPTAAQETRPGARDCPRGYRRAGGRRAYGESAARHEGPARRAVRPWPGHGEGVTLHRPRLAISQSRCARNLTTAASGMTCVVLCQIS